MKLAKGKCRPIEGRTKNVRGKSVERQKDLKQKLVKSVSQDAPAEFFPKEECSEEGQVIAIPARDPKIPRIRAKV